MKRLTLSLLFVLVACDDSDLEQYGAQTDGVIETPIEGVCVDDEANGDPFADCIEAFEPGPDASFGHDLLPDVVLGPPVADEAGGGSMDVVSLGCGGSITLAFDGEGIVDGPGADLLVFENAFPVGEQTFAEPARVLVSDDGEDWRAFECLLSGDESWPPTGCAGVTPTANVDASGAADPMRAGGDAFDLAEVGLSRARYVRLVDVSEPYFGDQTWCTGAAGGFDLDAVAAVPR